MFLRNYEKYSVRYARVHMMLYNCAMQGDEFNDNTTQIVYEYLDESRNVGVIRDAL
jgi:hypothetical protein